MSRYEAAREDNTLAEAMAAGRTALREGAWAAAIDAFPIVTERAAAGDPLVAEAWEAVGQAAYWRDDASRAIEAHERAFSAYRRLNEPAAAARTALWLADDHLSFFSAGAVANGWVEQAERLLESTPSAPEQAWLPIYQGHCALQLEYDTERALSFAADALERARSLGVPAAEVVALALEAQGRSAEADSVWSRFESAWRDADTTLDNSRF